MNSRRFPPRGAWPHVIVVPDFEARLARLDYGQIIVHVFQRSSRQFYDIEHLWADAGLQFIENIN